MTSPARFRLAGLACATLVALTAPAWADRTVTDQLGRRVTIPDTVSRAVVLQHQTLDIAVELGAREQVVGVLDEWKKQLGAGFARLDPGIESQPMPGGLTKVNVEELVKLNPDVVFVTNYAPPDMIKQIEAVHVPVIAISLLDVPPEEAGKQSPVVAGDEAAAFDRGFQTGVRLIAEVFGRQPQGEALIAAATESRALVADRLKDLPEADRVRSYMANPDLGTYGRGKYTGLMMQRAGALNVAAEDVQGFKQVTMEQVIGWDPAVIFVQNRYPQLVDQIKADPAWQSIAAVRDGRVILMPEYAKAWGYAMPEAMALGELWMAKTLYPDRFADIDMDARAGAYYRQFYGVDYQP